MWRSRAYSRLKELLTKQHYSIPRIYINGNTGKLKRNPNPGDAEHWLVVTGLSTEWNRGEEWQWVRVYNPFDNQAEYYWWDDFWNNWTPKGGSHGLMVVAIKEWQIPEQAR